MCGIANALKQACVMWPKLVKQHPEPKWIRMNKAVVKTYCSLYWILHDLLQVQKRLRYLL